MLEAVIRPSSSAAQPFGEKDPGGIGRCAIMQRQDHLALDLDPERQPGSSTIAIIARLSASGAAARSRGGDSPARRLQAMTPRPPERVRNPRRQIAHIASAEEGQRAAQRSASAPAAWRPPREGLQCRGSSWIRQRSVEIKKQRMAPSSAGGWGRCHDRLERQSAAGMQAPAFRNRNSAEILKEVLPPPVDILAGHRVAKARASVPGVPQRHCQRDMDGLGQFLADHGG